MKYLETQKGLPKLMLYVNDGFLIKRWDAYWIEHNIPQVEAHNMGYGGHYMQEYNPQGIGQALSLWMKKNQL